MHTGIKKVLAFITPHAQELLKLFKWPIKFAAQCAAFLAGIAVFSFVLGVLRDISNGIMNVLKAAWGKIKEGASWVGSKVSAMFESKKEEAPAQEKAAA